MPDSDVPHERGFDPMRRREFELWLNELLIDGSMPNAPELLKNDLQIVLDWLAVKTVKDIGSRERHEWVRGFERYDIERSDWLYGPEEKSRVSDVLYPPLTDEIRGVFGRMIEIDYHRLFLSDEEIAEMRGYPRVVSVSSQPSANENSNNVTKSTSSDSLVFIIKGVAGFVSGFILIFGFEVLLFSGMQSLSGHRLNPAGAGWIVMPIAAGCGGWVLFREIDISKIIGADRVLTELRKWPHDHQIAFIVIVAIGWIGGVLVGYFVSIASGADYYPRTLGTWLLGRWDWSSYDGLTVRYFPWASLGWGFVGGALGAAIVYAKQLLRSERSR